MSTTKLDPLTLRRVAVAGDGVHESTITSYLAGGNVRHASRLRIERALLQLGLPQLIRPAAILDCAGAGNAAALATGSGAR